VPKFPSSLRVGADLRLGRRERTELTIDSALTNATGDKAGIVVCEIPSKQQWCSIRETVFSFTATKFPFHTSSARKLKLIETPIISVVGKAYFDVGHAPKDQSNKRSHLPEYAAWELHPVMKLNVQ